MNGDERDRSDAPADHLDTSIEDIRAQMQSLAQRVEALTAQEADLIDDGDDGSDSTHAVAPTEDVQAQVVEPENQATEPEAMVGADTYADETEILEDNVTPLAVGAGPAPQVPPAPKYSPEPKGVRLGDLPRPVAERSRVPVALGVLFALLLIGGAFFAGEWWAERQETPSPEVDVAQDPNSAAEGQPEGQAEPPSDDAAPPAGEEDPNTAPSEVPSAEATTSPPTTAPPPTTQPPSTTEAVEIDEETVTAAASDALAAAGYPDILVTFESGTLFLDGVLPSGDLQSGYFAYVQGATAAVEDIADTALVVPRLYLRGDDEGLRRELAAISDEQPIAFALGGAEPTDAARAALADAARVILANPGLRVLVAGHTDASGGADANAQLAALRARSVIQELVANGVPITRLQAVSYGELFPGAEGSDASNRRVEFEVAP